MNRWLRTAALSAERLPEGVKSFRSKDAASFVKKRIGIMGGVHGNESLGIRLIQDLQQQLESKKLKIDCKDAELVLIEGNPKAIEIRKRGSTTSEDLNRCFNYDNINASSTPPNSSYENKRARELAPILEQIDLMVDIHATNKPSEPFVRIGGVSNVKHMNLCSWFSSLAKKQSKMLKIVLDPFCTLGGEICTTDEYVNFTGGTAVCLETGQASDESNYETVLKSILQMLSSHVDLCHGDGDSISYNALGSNQFLFGPTDLLMEGKSRDKDGSVKDEAVFQIPIRFRTTFEPFMLSRRHLLAKDKLTFEDNFGSENWQEFKTGDRIGVESSNDDENDTNEVFAKEDGFILFPKVPELQLKGSPVFWTATKVDTSLPKQIKIPKIGKKNKFGDISLIAVQNYVKRLEQFNRDSFLHFCWGNSPGFYRKGAKADFDFVSPDNTEKANDSNHGNRSERALQNDAIRGKSMEFGVALNLYRGYLSRSNLGTSLIPPLAKKTFLYQENETGETHQIYPKVFQEGESFFAKAESPYKSPQLEFPFSVKCRLEEGKTLILLKLSALENVEWNNDALVKSFCSLEALDAEAFDITESDVIIQLLSNINDVQEGRLDFVRISDESGVEFVGFSMEMVGETFMSLIEDKQRNMQSLVLKGAEKDEVGFCYVRVLSILKTFAFLLQQDIFLLHPLFNQRGLVVKKEGIREKIFLPQPSI